MRASSVRMRTTRQPLAMDRSGCSPTYWDREPEEPNVKLCRKLYTLETVSELRTDGAFRKAYQRNREDQSRMTDSMIAAGRGHWRSAEQSKAAREGDELAILAERLDDESSALRWRAEQWFGRAPYLI